MLSNRVYFVFSGEAEYRNRIYLNFKPFQELNFGAIGFTIGHELSHAFDDNGRKYDGAGNLVDWWEEGSVRGFKERTTCLQEQFGNFTLFNASVNGRKGF